MSLSSPKARPTREQIFTRYEQGESAEKLAEEFNVERQRIYNIVSYLARKRERSPPRRLTIEDRDRICELYRQGYSTRYIAERFDRAPKTILEILSERGVEVDRGYPAGQRKDR